MESIALALIGAAARNVVRTIADCFASSPKGSGAGSRLLNKK
ncbi:MAG: hypothetical protein V4535_11390 [Bacteroidota bacterium]